jgi:hypothetical protein
MGVKLRLQVNAPTVIALVTEKFWLVPVTLVGTNEKVSAVPDVGAAEVPDGGVTLQE